MMMRDPWFWLWMGPLLTACFAAIFAGGYAFMWLIDNNPWDAEGR